MDRLFLDANIIFSVAWRPKSTLIQLWRLKKAGSVELVTSLYAVEEARRNLESAKQQEDLDRLLRQVDISEPSIVPPVLPQSIRLPEKDRPILLAAISASATHLITGDIAHFGSLFGKTVEGVKVMAAGVYLGESQRSAREQTAISSIRQDAQERGLDQMTMKEIDAEVKAARKTSSKPRPK